MKRLYFSTEGWNLHPAQSPAKTALCCIIYSVTYSSGQGIHLRIKLKLQVAGDSSLCFLWALVLQNNWCQLEKLMLAGWEELGCQWLRDKPQVGVGEEACFKSLRQKVKDTFTSRAGVERPQSFLSLLSFQTEGRKRKVLGISLRKMSKIILFYVEKTPKQPNNFCLWGEREEVKSIYIKPYWNVFSVCEFSCHPMRLRTKETVWKQNMASSSFH